MPDPGHTPAAAAEQLGAFVMPIFLPPVVGEHLRRLLARELQLIDTRHMQPVSVKLERTIDHFALTATGSDTALKQWDLVLLTAVTNAVSRAYYHAGVPTRTPSTLAAPQHAVL